MNIDSLPIYVAHCKRLVERRERLEREMNGMGLTCQWILNDDAVELTEEAYRCYYRYDENEFRRKTNWYCDFVPRRLKPAEISLAIKHLTAYQSIVSSRHEYALILEDDVIFHPDFKASFDKMFNHVPDDFDFIFLGDCCDLRIHNPQDGIYFYRKDDPATKCTDSYIISQSAAKTLLNTMIPFHLAADFELNHQIRDNKMVVYWIEPPLISQNAFESTIQ